MCSGYVLCVLKIAQVLPLHKRKERHLMTSYRPISILPTLSKVLDWAICSRVYAFLNDNGRLYQYQYGFRKKHTTVDATSQFIKTLYWHTIIGNILLQPFLLWAKLWHYWSYTISKKTWHHGIRRLALVWLHNYLSNPMQYVECNKAISVLYLYIRAYRL